MNGHVCDEPCSRLISESNQLLEAVRLGDLSKVQYCIQHNNIDVNYQNEEGETAMYIAADVGEVEIARFLLQCEGVDVNLKPLNERTPFYNAARVGQIEIVKLLLTDPRVHSHAIPSGESPLGMCSLFPGGAPVCPEIQALLFTHPNVILESGITASENMEKIQAAMGMETQGGVCM